MNNSLTFLVLVSMLSVFGLQAQTDIELSSAATPDIAEMGETITYSLTATNNSTTNATNVSVFYELPFGLNLTTNTATLGNYNPNTNTWTIGNLNANTSATLSIEAVLEDGREGLVSHNAYVQSASPNDVDSSPDNTIALEDDFTQACSTIPVKLCSTQTLMASTMDFGEPIQWYKDGIAIPNATALELSITEAGTYTTKSSNIDANCPENDCCPLIVERVDCIDLELTKTAELGNFSNDAIIYTLTVVNNGPDNATNVEVTDILDDNLSLFSAFGAYTPNTGIWNVGEVPAGESATLILETIVLDASQTVVNTAEVTAATEFDTDSRPGNGNTEEDDYSEVETNLGNFNCDANISGLIWNDANENGVFDNDETLLSGITINLNNENGSFIQSTTSNNGNYTFNDVNSNNYQISINDAAYQALNISIALDCDDITDANLPLIPSCLPFTEFLCVQPMIPIQICPDFCIENAIVENVEADLFECSLDILSENCIEYIALPAFDGTDVLTITACNANGECEDAQMTVSTEGDCFTTNLPPNAADDIITTVSNAAVNIDVLQNDSDPEGSSLSISTYSFPENGTLTLNGTDFVYTPNNNFNGTDAFTYQVCDNQGNCSLATVVISIGNSCDANILFIGENTSNSRDNLLIERLESEGYNVTFILSSIAEITDIAGIDLIYMSATTYAGQIGNTFRNVALPVVVAEPFLFDNMRMTLNGVDYLGTDTKNKQINIIDDTHPLAAGLTNGTVDITTQNRSYVWGNPTGDAIKIATLTDNPNRYTLFAYETGSEMVNLTAPARRVGFFAHNKTPDRFTDDAFALFDATIAWALGDCNESEACEGEVSCVPMMETLEICPEFCQITGDITITNVSTNYNCTIEITAENCIAYTPLPMFSGIEVITIEACSTLGVCETKNIVVEVSENCTLADELAENKNEADNQSITNDYYFNMQSISNSNELKVNIQNSEDIKNSTISIYGLQGHLITQRKVDLLKGTNSAIFNIKKLPKAMYIISVATDTQKISNKFVK